MPDEDERALRAFKLDKEALVNLQAIVQDADKLPRQKGEEADGASPMQAKNIDEAVRILERNPQLKALLQRHGMDARAYWMSSIALMRAAVASEMKLTDPADLAKSGTNADNVSVVSGNRALVTSILSGRDDAEDEEADEAGTGEPERP